jgi:hypothetical protein
VVLGAKKANGVCDAGEVAAVDDDGGVPAVREERSQWGIALLEPPEMRMGCTGCHARTV